MAAKRDIPAQLKTNSYWKVLLYEFHVVDDPLYIHNDVGNIVWEGRTYVGFGGLISDNGTADDGQLAPDNLTFTLNVWREDLVAAIGALTYRGRMCRKLEAVRDIATGAVIGEPYELYRGMMGAIYPTPGQQAISLASDDERILLNMPYNKSLEPPLYKAKFPGDKFTDLVKQLKDEKIRVGAEGLLDG